MKKLAVAVMGAAWLMTATPCYGQYNFSSRECQRDFASCFDKQIQRERERIQDRYYQNAPRMDDAAQRRYCNSIQGNDRAQRRCFESLR